MHEKYNVGDIRLKFTYSRASSKESDNLPFSLSSQEAVLSLYSGLLAYKKLHPSFRFVLSPCFRKEAHFFDVSKYSTKKEDFDAQVSSILSLLSRHPELEPYLCEADTVGSAAQQSHSRFPKLDALLCSSHPWHLLRDATPHCTGRRNHSQFKKKRIWRVEN